MPDDTPSDDTPSDDTLGIEIDGRACRMRKGQMVIEVADANAIPIPRFCYHYKLTVAANCRMCLVEVEQVPKPLPACATPVMEGMLAPATRMVVPLPALAGARGAGPGALRGEPRRVRSEAMSEYAQKRRGFFRQPIFGSGYAGLGDIQSSNKSKIPFRVLSKRSEPSCISVA